MRANPPAEESPETRIDSVDNRQSLPYEWPQTDLITVLMGAVLANNVKAVARMVKDKGIIWNQKGPCGRTPENAALDLGHLGAHAMLLAVREQAELSAQSFSSSVQGPMRL